MQRNDVSFAALLRLLAIRAPADRARLATRRHALRVAAVGALQATTRLTSVLQLLSRKARFRFPVFAERTLQLLAILAQERLDVRQGLRHVLRIQLWNRLFAVRPLRALRVPAGPARLAARLGALRVPAIKTSQNAAGVVSVLPLLMRKLRLLLVRFAEDAQKYQEKLFC